MARATLSDLRIVVSGTNNSRYLPYWPIIKAIWEQLFGASVDLVFVHYPGDEKVIQELVSFSPIYLVPAVAGYSMRSLGLVARYYYISQLAPDVVCSINDLDLLPLTSEYYTAAFRQWEPGKLLCIGHDVYRGSEDDGKFPSGYTTGDASTFRKIWNPDCLEWPDFLQQLTEVSLTGNELRDETLFRQLIDTRLPKDRIIKMDRGWHPYTAKAICRSAWAAWTSERLWSGDYIECHAPWPFDEAKLAPILEYIRKGLGVSLGCPLKADLKTV